MNNTIHVLFNCLNKKIFLILRNFFLLINNSYKNVVTILIFIILINLIKFNSIDSNTYSSNIAFNKYVIKKIIYHFNNKIKEIIILHYKFFIKNNYLKQQNLLKLFEKIIVYNKNQSFLYLTKKSKSVELCKYLFNNYLYFPELSWNFPSYEKNNEVLKEKNKVNRDYDNNYVITVELIDNFISNAKSAGLTNEDIDIIIKNLKYQINFKNLKVGDKMSILKIKKTNRNIKEELVGIRLNTGGRDYYAFKAYNGKFYNRNGVGIKKFCFMKLPTRCNFPISSKFNPKRINPVTGKVSPHRGVDLAAPIDTPVLSVGEGEIIMIKNDNYAGNYIIIKHSYNYLTKYMHLNKVLVQKGQKVKKGDIIALSGNTGYSTGPHIHFEVWINHKAVNPLTVKYNFNDILIGEDKIKYLVYIDKIIPKLKF